MMKQANYVQTRPNVDRQALSHDKKVLITFIKALADGEIDCERERQHLSEMVAFLPAEVFRDLQGSPLKGYITVRDVHSWLSDQPHQLPRLLLQDVAAFVLPYCDSHNELHFEGFLRMILPKDDASLNARVLKRNATRPPSDSGDGFLAREVACGLCRLFEAEIDITMHCNFHRKALQEHGVSPVDAFVFLSSGKVFSCSLSAWELRRLLLDRLGELSAEQCSAFYRRATGFSGTGSITREQVVRLLSHNTCSDDACGRTGSVPRIGKAPRISSVATSSTASAAPSPRMGSPRVGSRGASVTPSDSFREIPVDQVGSMQEGPFTSRRSISDSGSDSSDSDEANGGTSPRSVGAFQRPLSPSTMSPRTLEFARVREWHEPVAAERAVRLLKTVLSLMASWTCMSKKRKRPSVLPQCLSHCLQCLTWKPKAMLPTGTSGCLHASSTVCHSAACSCFFSRFKVGDVAVNQLLPAAGSPCEISAPWCAARERLSTKLLQRQLTMTVLGLPCTCTATRKLAPVVG